MERDDRVRVVRAMGERGLFLIKGSVERVARVLGVSRYTVYNYLGRTPATRPAPKPAGKVTAEDLPLACPMPQMYLWNSHPRVYLPIEPTGWAKCPYCSAEYTLHR